MRICILCSFYLHCKIYVPEKVHYYISSFLPLFHKLSHTHGIYPVANIFILKFTYQGRNILPYFGSFFSFVSRHFYLPFYICETEDEGLHTSFPSSFLTVCKRGWGCSAHGLSQQGVWVPSWTPKPLKRTPQDIQNF